MVLYNKYPHHHLLLFCAQEIYMVLGNETFIQESSSLETRAASTNGNNVYT